MLAEMVVEVMLSRVGFMFGGASAYVGAWPALSRIASTTTTELRKQVIYTILNISYYHEINTNIQSLYMIRSQIHSGIP